MELLDHYHHNVHGDSFKSPLIYTVVMLATNELIAMFSTKDKANQFLTKQSYANEMIVKHIILDYYD